MAMNSEDDKDKRNPDEKMKCAVLGCGPPTGGSAQAAESLSSVRFFPLPDSDREGPRRTRWLAAIMPPPRFKKLGQWPPSSTAHICSQHFVRGEPNLNANDIDFVPSVLPWKRAPRKISLKTPASSERVERILQSTGYSLSSKDLTPPTKQRKVESSLTQINRDFIPPIMSKNIEFDESTFEDSNSMQTTSKTKLAMKQQSVAIQCKLEGEFTSGFVFQSKSLPCTFNWKKEIVSHLETQCSIPSGLHDPIMGDANNLNYNPFLSPQNTSDVVGIPALGLDLMVLMLKKSVTASSILSLEEQVMLFLMKLKHNPTFAFLGALFKISENLSKEIFKEILKVTHDKATSYEWWHYMTKLNLMSSQRFKINFPQCRGIYDFFEVMVQSEHANHLASTLTFSGSSKLVAFKMRTLMVVTPSEVIAFLSSAQPSHVSEMDLVNQSGLLGKLLAGDMILSDKELPRIVEEEKSKFVVLPPDSVKSSEGESVQDGSPRKFVQEFACKLRHFQILNFLEYDLLEDIDSILKCVAFISNHFPELGSKTDE